MNFLLMTDSYKLTHWKQYPPGTEHVYSYLESRGGMFSEVTFFGLQYYLSFLQEKAFYKEDIEEAEEFCVRHFGEKTVFNREGWEYILSEYYGRLPIRIQAVPEGSTIPISNVLMTVENTDSKVPWLTNYVETFLLKVWYPTTVCTLSRQIRKLILRYLGLTGDPSLIDFKLHDFGYRGVSSEESAAIGGAAHLVNFKGTDTIAAIEMIAQMYPESDSVGFGNLFDGEMPGFSIPATEHSTITSWGEEDEKGAYRNVLEQYPKGLVACVSDSYDIYNACDEVWGKTLRQLVESRDGTLVVRPDSGDPVIVVPKVMEILGARFGFSVNEKQYKVLNPKIRVIQGDGVNYQSIESILAQLRFRGWSADNIAFGMGGALLQQVNRDTQQFAIKASSVQVNGVERDVYKLAVGKESKKGRLDIRRFADGSIATVREGYTSEGESLLQTVFEEGKIKVRSSFKEIRGRACDEKRPYNT